MDMQMRNAFACVRAAVNHNSITALFDAEFFRKIARHEQKFSEQRTFGLGCSGQTWDHFFWNDQHVHRRLRIDVVKRDRVVIFPNDLGRNLTRDDFFKDRHGPNQRSEHFSRSIVVVVDVSRSRMKQTISSRKESQARVQVFTPRKCFTQACSEQSCKLSTPVSTSALIRFSRQSKKASS